MNLITHGLAGWCFGRSLTDKPSDAMFLTFASFAPDLDAVGAVIDLINGEETVYFTRFHHKFGHNIFAGILVTILVMSFSKSVRTGLWGGVIFHFHLLCDLVGAKGPDGYKS